MSSDDSIGTTNRIAHMTTLGADMNISIEDLEKNLKLEKLDSIYVFYGEEKFLLDNSLKKIKKIFGNLITGINYIIIDENNINELISDIETPAFGYEKKLIIVKASGIL